MKKWISLIVSIIFNSLLSGKDETWESNVAEISGSQISNFISNSFSESPEIVLKDSQGARVDDLIFLLRESSYRSVEEVSKSYRHLVEDFEESADIERVEYLDSYKVSGPSEEFLSIELIRESGWGANRDRFRNLRELYLSTGEVDEGSLVTVRTSPKRNLEFYKEVIRRTTLTDPRKFNIEEIEGGLWVTSYSYHRSNSSSGDLVDKTKGVIYSEQFGISIEFEKNLLARDAVEESDVEMQTFSKKVANEVFKIVRDKGIIPSKQYVHYMKERREKYFGSVAIPDFLSNYRLKGSKEKTILLPNVGAVDPNASDQMQMVNQKKELITSENYRLLISLIVVLVTGIAWFFLRKKGERSP